MDGWGGALIIAYSIVLSPSPRLQNPRGGGGWCWSCRRRGTAHPPTVPWRRHSRPSGMCSGTVGCNTVEIVIPETEKMVTTCGENRVVVHNEDLNSLFLQLANRPQLERNSHINIGSAPFHHFLSPPSGSSSPPPPYPNPVIRFCYEAQLGNKPLLSPYPIIIITLSRPRRCTL